MTEPKQRTRPSVATRNAERAESQVKREADRTATPEAEENVEDHVVDPAVAEHEKDMLTRGANQRGEGRLP